jgi:hypothetical protein
MLAMMSMFELPPTSPVALVVAVARWPTMIACE